MTIADQGAQTRCIADLLSHRVVWAPIHIDTGTHIVKTTVELSDELAGKAKAFAARNRMTLRALIEQGIRQVLREDSRPRHFKLRDRSVGGNGLQKEYDGADWARIRDAAYKGRGT